MTDDWKRFSQHHATNLAAVRTRTEFDVQLAALDVQLASGAPEDFWPEFYSDYRKAPKPLLREALAASALNMLLAAADATLKARAQKK